MGFDFDLLIQEIRNGKVVPIIGTELYIDETGTSLEDTIASSLAVELEVPGRGPGATLRDVALAYLMNRGELPRLTAAIRRVFQLAITRPPRALQQLAEITDFRLYVTTAIDRMLEHALDDARGGESLSVTYSPSRPTLELPDIERAQVPVVCHLLGRIDDDFPLGDADVIEYLQALLGAARPKRLFDELRGRNLLFIGCGFPDWLSRLFIRMVKDKEFTPGYAERRAQFIADARAASDANLTLFLTHYNLKLHPPGPTTAFVDRLHTLWTASAQPRPPRLRSEQATMKADSVFLSFSSEDRDTVREIGRRLREDAHLEIWFDETGIEIGADWNRMIQDNLLKAALFVPFISRNTQDLAEQAHYFWFEWNLAHERSRFFASGARYILPVALDPIDPTSARVPDSFRVPEWFELHGRIATQKFVDFIRTEVRRKKASKL